jgi:hypothetical protein
MELQRNVYWFEITWNSNEMDKLKINRALNLTWGYILQLLQKHELQLSGEENCRIGWMDTVPKV